MYSTFVLQTQNVTGLDCRMNNNQLTLNFDETDLPLIIGQVFSLICCLFIIISYLSLQGLRTQPNNLFGLKSFFDFCFAVTVSISPVQSLDYTAKSDTRNNSYIVGSEFEEPICFCEQSFVLGTLTQFFVMASELTLLAVSIDLVVNLKSPFTQFDVNNHIYRASVISIAGISCIIYALLPTDMTGEWILGFCLYTFRLKGEGLNYGMWFNFLGPILLIHFIIIIMLIYACVLRNKNKNGHSESTFAARQKVFVMSFQYCILNTIVWILFWSGYAYLNYLVTTSEGDIDDENLSNSSLLIFDRVLKNSTIIYLTMALAGLLGLRCIAGIIVWILNGYCKLIKTTYDSIEINAEKMTLAPEMNFALRHEIVMYIQAGVKELYESYKAAGSKANELRQVNLLGLNGDQWLKHKNANRSGASTVPVSKTAKAGNAVADVEDSSKKENFEVRAVFRDDARQASAILTEFYAKQFGKLRMKFYGHDGQHVFANSITNLQAAKHTSGRSNSFLFLSNDEKFIVKTMSKNDFITMQSMMSFHSKHRNYIQHMENNPDSLICKIVGCYSLRLHEYSHTIYFIVMVNVLPPKGWVHEIYDLKGCNIRKTVEPERLGSRAVCKYCNESYIVGDKKSIKCTYYREHEPMQLLTDNDLRFRLIVKPQQANIIKAQIAKDANWLKSMQIMDYSLLVGVRRKRYPLGSVTPVIQFCHEEQDTSKKLESSSKDGPLKSRKISKALSQYVKDQTLNFTSERSDVVVSPMPSEAIADDNLINETESPTHSQAQRLGENEDKVANSNITSKIANDYKNQNGLSAYVIEGPSTFYLGIIDIFQTWNLSKKVENCAKRTFQCTGMGISSVDPEFYQERFVNYCCEKVIESLDGHVEVQSQATDSQVLLDTKGQAFPNKLHSFTTILNDRFESLQNSAMSRSHRLSNSSKTLPRDDSLSLDASSAPVRPARKERDKNQDEIFSMKLTPAVFTLLVKNADFRDARIVVNKSGEATIESSRAHLEQLAKTANLFEMGTIDETLFDEPLSPRRMSIAENLKKMPNISNDADNGDTIRVSSVNPAAVNIVNDANQYNQLRTIELRKLMFENGLLDPEDETAVQSMSRSQMIRAMQMFRGRGIPTVHPGTSALQI